MNTLNTLSFTLAVMSGMSNFGKDGLLPLPKDRSKDVDYAVYMMQWQKQGDYVFIGPGPGFQQGLYLSANRVVGTDNTLWFVSGAAGKEHHGATGRLYIWEGSRLFRQDLTYGAKGKYQVRCKGVKASMCSLLVTNRVTLAQVR